MLVTMLKKIFVFCFVIKFGYSYFHDSDECYHQVLQKKGICIPVHECPREKQFLKKELINQKCGKEDNFVCCPVDGDLAEDKCEMYAGIYNFIRSGRTRYWQKGERYEYDEDDEWGPDDFEESLEDYPKYYYEDGLIWKVYPEYKTFFIDHGTLKIGESNKIQTTLISTDFFF